MSESVSNVNVGWALILSIGNKII